MTKLKLEMVEKVALNLLTWLDMVAQICNLSFLGGRGLEGHSLRSVWAKSF
jgi:hypothetical protein